MQSISTSELRERYQRFFESKGHTRVPSASLVPEHDPSVLFTTAGMHPLVPYLKSQPHPAGKRLTDVQKCLRTTDIDKVGDATHATVFEMLGNWSLGDYFKREAITWSYQFLTGKEWLGIDPANLAVSVFAGNEGTPRDEESAATWKELGIPDKRIAYLGLDDNWWPAGGDQPGPQGPDSEMFFWTSSEAAPKKFDPKDKRWVEIWNDVFMQFNRDERGNLTELPQKNVDTGMGVERTVMILNGLASIYDIDTFKPLMELIEEAVAKDDIRHKRILADHIKAATFVLGDEHPVIPSNTDQGYVLRRIIRRAVRSARMLGVPDVASLLTAGSEIMIDKFGEHYVTLRRHSATIQTELVNEAGRFSRALERGIPLVQKVLRANETAGLTGAQAFDLVSTYGVPLEDVNDLAKEMGIYFAPDFESEFDQFFVKHQRSSAQAARGKFAGGLVDHSEMSVKYHTATHVLHQALRDVLGLHVFQKGSKITPERLRFDFSYAEKMTPEQIARVEKIVNEKIQADLGVTRVEMTVSEAKARGALGLFEDTYADRVSVYAVADYSVEICGGPHVSRTGELGRFHILKEESAGAGVRRIKAVLE